MGKSVKSQKKFARCTSLHNIDSLFCKLTAEQFVRELQCTMTRFSLYSCRN